MPRKKKEEPRAPKGGWLGPPPTEGLAPIGEYVPGKKGKPWRLVKTELTKKQKKLRQEWNRRMKKADKKDKWRFKWPPKDLD
jgi:hypothetical protein